MTREEALSGLSSDSPHERTKAARFFLRHVNGADIPVLRSKLQTEAVAYVRSILELALRKAGGSGVPESNDFKQEFDVPPEVKNQIKTQAIEEVAGLLLHEIASPVGLLAASATREIPNFGASRTKRHIQNLQRLFGAIEQLKCAAGVPKPQEFDLAELLAEIVTEERGERTIDIALHGTRPFVIVSDPALLRLAICNGIRNAIEAVQESSQAESHPVVVTWGQTDIDYWVSVLDRGSGLVGPAESAFDIGKTTKRGHSGFGLTIARQAIETLAGSCTLQPAADGGVRFEARWER